MRRSLAFVLVLPFLAPAAARAEVPSVANLVAAPTAVRADGKHAALQVTIDRAKVDLVNHKLEVKLSNPAEKVRLKVIGQSGAVLAELEKAFDGAAPGTALVVSWKPSSEEVVARIEVWGHDTDGYFAGVAITPWNVALDHEQVNFESDSDVIRSSETPKLEASLQKIKDVLAKYAGGGQVTLYLLGHTDTVGTPEHNLTLSRKRARAIAAWFKGHGLKLPVAYEGMGESSLLVKTADEVDEPKNRRTDYVLSVDPPSFSSSDKSWKTL